MKSLLVPSPGLDVLKLSQGEWWDPQLQDFIEYMTAPAPETVEEVAGVRGLEGRILQERSMALAESLAVGAAGLREQIVEDSRGDTSLLQAIDAGKAGFYASDAELYDISSSMARGLPLEVETRFMPGDNAGDSCITVLKQFVNLNGIAPVCRPVFLLDDLVDITTGELLTWDKQTRLFVDTVSELQNNGILRPDMEPGADFIFTSLCDMKERIPQFLDNMQTVTPYSSYVKLFLNSRERFYPSGLIDFRGKTIDLRNVKQPPSIEPEFLLLAEAASYRNPSNRYFTHIGLTNSQSWDRRAGLRQLLHNESMVLAEDMQTIGLRNPGPGHHPDLPAYAFIRQLERSMREFGADQEKFASFVSMRAKDYARHSYGAEVTGLSESGLLPDDDEILCQLVPWLLQRFALGEIKDDVLNIGAGAGNYLDKTIAPFLDKHARLYTCDPAPDNREYQQAYKDGTLEEEFAEIGPKQERRMVEIGGSAYKGSDERARNAIIVDNGNIYNLPKKRFKVILEGYVAASIRKEWSMYVKAIRSEAEALLDDESIIIGLEILDSDGWQTGLDEEGKPIQFPSTRMSIERIQRAYKAAGLDAFVTPISAEGPTLRKGYKGMAIVIAWPASAPSEVATRNCTIPSESWR